MNRIRAELRVFAQGVVEVLHAFDVVSAAGPPWRWRVIDTGSAERIAAVRAGLRRVGPDVPAPRTVFDDMMDELHARRRARAVSRDLRRSK
ncbi:hypothetical protein AB0J43_05495 [Nonomuraea fuscirosea]